MPTDDADKIWAAYAKGVKPIGGGKRKSHKPSPASPVTRKRATGSAPSPAVRERETPALRRRESEKHTSLDRNLERRLRRGEIEMDARLDLHGMRQHEAHTALNDFITRQIKAGHRCLLIITGKGRGGEGVLRANLAGWLTSSDHAAKILALRPAAIRHGGAGAAYVLLKRRKDSA